MGLLKSIFKASEPKEEKILPWIPLNTTAQLSYINEKSKSKTQIVFKHSTRCGISRMVMKQFVASYTLTDKEADLYYLDLLSYREISNEVGYAFQVFHESPQILIIKNGVVVAHASHGGVNAIELPEYI